MQVSFTPNVQARLDQLAVETGRPREDFVSDALTGYLEELTQLGTLLGIRYDDLKSGRVGLVSAEQVRTHFIRKGMASAMPRQNSAKRTALAAEVRF